MMHGRTVFLILTVLLLTWTFNTLAGDTRDPRRARSDAPATSNVTQQMAILAVNAGYVYVDSLNGANDTTALRARGYSHFYRGTGPQGAAPTWFQGSASVFHAYNGDSTGYLAANFNVVTATNNIDSWLVFPALDLQLNDTLKFFERSPTGSTYHDTLRVMFSVLGDTVPEASSWVEIDRFETTTDGTWHQRAYAVPTSALKARFAIRYAVAHGGPSSSVSNYVGIDMITIERTGEHPQFFNLATGAASNSYPFAQTGGKAVNSIFLAGEFSNPTPLPGGQAITRVYFRTAGAVTRTFTDLKILMAQDAITTLTSGSFYAGPYDTVYASPSVTLTSTINGWMGITLDHPFVYDTSKSLILFVGQCGTTGIGLNVRNSTLTGIRRVWSVAGCPFDAYAGGDGSMVNFGVDVIPVAGEPQYYNLNNGTYGNNYPFTVAAGRAVNTVFQPGDFQNPTPLPPGQAITKVYFRTGTTGGRVLTDLTILMAQDNITELTSGVFYPGPYDTVYYHPTTTLASTVNGWMGVTLDKPFPYDPAKSLILFVGQCGSVGKGMVVQNSNLTGIRRVWANEGCPFTVYPSGDSRMLNFGVDVAPVATAYGVPDLLYYKFENGPPGFTPNSAVPGVGSNPSTLNGSILWGGMTDSALVGAYQASQGVATGWNMNIGGGSWTIGMWLQIPTSPSVNPFYLFGDPGSNGFRCFHNGAAYPDNILIRGGGIKDSILTGVGPGPTYVHFVYDSATATIRAYKNGELAYASVQPAPLNFPVGTGFRVGGYTSSYGFTGLMDEFRFYSRALDSTEIRLTWNQTLPFALATDVRPVHRTVPLAYELAQNYPNPFNPSTTISYMLPAAGRVTLKIYNVLGQEIRTLVDEQSAPGTFQVVWDGKNASGRQVASGVYFYTLTATSSASKTAFASSKKMVLLK